MRTFVDREGYTCLIKTPGIYTKESLKTFKPNISKFQFNLDVRHLSHEPLARVIAQTLPVLDIKLTFTFTLQVPKSVVNKRIFRYGSFREPRRIE